MGRSLSEHKVLTEVQLPREVRLDVAMWLIMLLREDMEHRLFATAKEKKDTKNELNFRQGWEFTTIKSTIIKIQQPNTITLASGHIYHSNATHLYKY